MSQPDPPLIETDEPPPQDASKVLESPSAEMDYPEIKSQHTARRRRVSVITVLDNLVGIATHPGFFLIVVAFMAVVFLVTRYAGNCSGNEVLLMISEDFYRWLTYALTIFITYIVTKFLERRKK